MAENPEIIHNFDPKYVSLGAEEPAAEFFILRRVLFSVGTAPPHNTNAYPLDMRYLIPELKVNR